MYTRRNAFCGLVLAAVLGFTGAALAQTAGSIAGTVRDPSGAVLPGAKVTLRGPALLRDCLETRTGEDGGYRFVPVPAGTYELTAALDGFRTEVHRDLGVGVDQDVELDLVLQRPLGGRGGEPQQLATIEETVVVEGGAFGVEAARSELASRVSPQAIENLPLNGRDFEDLVALVPGVKPEPGALRDRSFSVFGERPAATSFIVDGADNNDPVDGGTLQRFTQDAIQEFEVLTSGYEAEFGRAQGGVVNVVTRSGTDRFRGGAFVFARDGSLDSSNVPGQDAPDLQRRQWGATLGGPLRHDRAYFFVSTEVLDEQRGRNVDLATVPSWVRAGLATPGGSEDFSAGPTRDGVTAFGKIDVVPSARHHLSFHLNSNDDDAAGEVPPGIAGALVLPSATRSRELASTSFTFRGTWLRGSSAFLESSARFTSGRTLDNLDGGERSEAVLLLFQGNFIQTGSPLGGNRRDLDRGHLTQSYTWLRAGGRGEHEFKAGWEWLATDLAGFNQLANDVEYSAAFLAPDAPEIMEDLFARFGFQQSAARFFFLPGNADGSFELDMSNDDLGLYVRDKWRLARATVDLGLRWDRASLFGGDDDNFSPRLGFTWDFGGRRRTVLKASAGLFYDRNALIAASTVPEKGGVFTRNAFDVALPRLGFEYPGSLIDIVITSGLPGVFPPENPAYAALADALSANPLALYELLGIDVADPDAPPVVTADNVAALAGLSPEEAIALLESTFPGTDWEFFDVPGGSIVGDRVLSFFPRGPLGETRDVSIYGEDRTPRTAAYTVGFEQRLGSSWLLSAAYVRRRTEDLLTRRIVNLFDVPPGDPRFARTTDGGPRINQVTYDGRIHYDGFVASLERPFRGRWGLRFAYTWSDARDNLLTGEVGSGFSNNNHPELDWGPSNLSVPHVGVASGTALLPGDVRLSGNLFWRSGNAFSPRGIVDTDGDGLVDQRDLSVPRNSFRTGAFFQLDLRAEKAFAFASGHEMRLLVDVFNVTNEANVAGVNAVAGPGFGVPNSFFPGREVQLGIRYFLQ